jgi:phage terminase large subunit-like protein
MNLKTITNEQREALRFQLTQTLYKRDFFSFYKAAVVVLEPQTTWSFPAFLEVLCQQGQEIVENCANNIPQNDVCISVPPRTSKSYIFSVCLNAWAWTKYPHLKFMTVSYADNLSSKFAYKTRLLIKSDWYQKYFGDVYQLREDDNRKTAFSNDKSGSRESFGMTGSVTGSGCDICITDDLQKPSDTSDTRLDNVIDVYRDTIYNRVNNPSHGSVRLNIAQRVHERDITSYILENDSVKHICLPSELTKDVKPQYLSALYEDGLLWKQRFDADVLREYKKNAFYYNCQYLQNPLPSLGILIARRWFPIVGRETIPDKDWQQLKWEMYVDSAYTSNPQADETAVIIAAKYGNNVLIKKAYTWYLEFPQLLRKLQEIYTFHDVRMIRIEPKANGLSLIQTLKHDTTCSVTRTETPKDSKIMRITNITSFLESGRVMLLNDSNVEIQMQQYTAFPNSSKDGLCDCLYYLTNQNLNKQSTMKYAKA